MVQEGSTGYFYSVTSNTGAARFYVADQSGIFTAPNSFSGIDSGAVAFATAAWPPELDYDSGTLMFIQNFDAVTRATVRSELTQVNVQF